MPATAPLSRDSMVVLKEGLVDAEIDNEIVALKIDDGACYGLNQIGARIWRLLAAPIRIEDLCSALLTEYEVEPEVCECQVIELLEQLRGEGLISQCEGE